MKVDQKADGGDDFSPAESTEGAPQGWKRLVPSERARWSSVVEILQIFSSTLVFMVLADAFTRDQYGIMTGVIGAVAPALSLSTLGTHVLLTRRTARGEDLSEAWKRAFTIGLASPTAMAVVMLILHPVLFPSGNVPWSVYALFVVAGLPFFWMSELVAFIPIGFADMRSAAIIRFATFVSRIVALAWFLFLSGGTLLQWAVAHAASFVVAGTLGVVFIYRKYNLRPGLGTGLAADVKEGVPFSMSGATENVFDAADRVLLVRFGLEDDAGIYGLGGRITQFGYAPIRILLRSRDAELHRAGGQGPRSAVEVARKMLLPGLALGLGTAVILWICAPLVPLILGERWDPAVPAIRLLAFLPALRSVQYLVGNTITAFDRQPWRFGATAVAAVLNLVLNVIYLPTGTWRTAVATTFVSEVFLVTALLAVVWYWLQRESKGTLTN